MTAHSNPVTNIISLWRRTSVKYEYISSESFLMETVLVTFKLIRKKGLAVKLKPWDRNSKTRARL